MSALVDYRGNLQEEQVFYTNHVLSLVRATFSIYQFIS
jgi:hypothetical protein